MASGIAPLRGAVSSRSDEVRLAADQLGIAYWRPSSPLTHTTLTAGFVNVDMTISHDESLKAEAVKTFPLILAT